MQIVSDAHSPIHSPQYVKIAERIEARRPKLTRPLKLPSENQLAREYGTGRDTMRRALGLLERSGAVTRQPGRGRGTHLHPIRMSPKSARGSTVAFVIPGWPGAQNEWYLSLALEGVTKWTDQHDCRLSIMQVDRMERDEQKILDKLAARDIAGVIWVQPIPRQRKLLSAISRRMPCVVIGREYDEAGIHAVLPDYHAAAQLLDSHLFARGHTHYTVIGRSPSDPYGESWLNAFEDAQAQRGAYFDDQNHFISIVPFKRDRLADLLMDYHLDLHTKTRALVLTSSSWLIPLLASERFRKLVPETISLAAFDYGIQPVSSYWTGHQVTHVTCDWREIGLKSVESVFSMIEGNEAPAVIRQPVSLVEGDTVFKL